MKRLLSTLLLLAACKGKSDSQPAPAPAPPPVSATKPAEPAANPDPPGAGTKIALEEGKKQPERLGTEAVGNQQELESALRERFGKLSYHLEQGAARSCDELLADIRALHDQLKPVEPSIITFAKNTPKEFESSVKGVTASSSSRLTKASGPVLERCKDNKALVDEVAALSMPPK